MANSCAKEAQASELESKYAEVTDEYGHDPVKLAGHYRQLIEKALELLRD